MPIAVKQSQTHALVKVAVFLNAREDLFVSQLISFLNNALGISAFLLNAVYPLVQHTFARFIKIQP
jgi:hypothetical protein